MKQLADDKKDMLQLAHDVGTFHSECQETMVSICWIVSIFLAVTRYVEFFEGFSGSVHMNSTSRFKFPSFAELSGILVFLSSIRF